MTSKLNFHDLAARHIGVTPAIGESLTEAARVCLDRHHTSSVLFKIRDNDGISDAEAEWLASDARTLAAWANTIDATEAGAYAMALAAVELKRGLVAVSRAETKTGADYYLNAHEAVEDLEGTVRLEVSGSDSNQSALESRLKQKLAQADAGNSNLPAVATIIGFKELRILIADLGGV